MPMDGQGAKSAADCPYTTDYYPAPLSIICLHEWGANPSTWYRCLSGSSSHPDVLPYKNCPYKTTRSIFLNQGASTHVFAHQGRTRRVREAHPPGTIISYDCMMATIVCFCSSLWYCRFPTAHQVRSPAAPAIHGGVHLQARFHVGKTIS